MAGTRQTRGEEGASNCSDLKKNNTGKTRGHRLSLWFECVCLSVLNVTRKTLDFGVSISNA